MTKPKKYLEINVTEEDIKSSTRSNTTQCMIAVAATRAGLENVNVECDEMTWGTDSGRHTYHFPEWIEEKITRFDMSDDGTVPVTPFKIRIPLKGAE